MEFDFSKNMEVTSLEAIPERYHNLYTQRDDETYAVAESVRNLVEDYVGQTTALNTTRTNLSKANDESAARRHALGGFDSLASELGIDPGDDIIAAFKNHFSELTQTVSNGQEVRINLEKIQQDADKRVLEAETKGNEKIELMEKSLHKYMISDAATAALAKSEGSVDLLMPHVERHCKVVQDGEDFVVRVVDAAGDQRSNGAGGWMSVADLVEEMKTDSRFQPAFKSEVKSGGGTPPSGQGRSLPTRKIEDMSSTDKIAAGLDKGQYVKGV